MKAAAHMRIKNTTLAWAVFRFLLGMGQIIGSATSAILLVTTGLSRLAVSGVALTSLLTLMSRLLFSAKGSCLGVSPFSRKKARIDPPKRI
jgi:hypothetical protein